MGLIIGVPVTGTHVFDRLSQNEHQSADAPSDEAVLTRLAEQLVTSSILSGRMLRELRLRMFPLKREAAAVAVAQTLRAEFQEWVQDAEATYARARQVEKSGKPVRGTGELGEMIGTTLAMLQITLEDHFRSLEQGPGRPLSIEELRRELQLKRGA